MKTPNVKCELCPRYCVLAEGQRGNCRVRENVAGRLKTLVYGKVCAAHIDPVEKKPQFHFLPGSSAFSIATAGCNLHCKFCQNWAISQRPPEETRNMDMPPEEVVRLAQEYKCESIAYTYSEPIVFYEFMLDTIKIAKPAGIKNIMVTAGYMNPEPCKNICKYIDAAHIDLKGITEDYYRTVSGGTLAPVQETIKTMHKEGIWIELINLVVPTLNDMREDIQRLCAWVLGAVGPDVPVHFSRFTPMYQLTNLPPTPESVLTEARNMAMSMGLHYVYVGNVPGHEGNHTYCPACKKLLIERIGYTILQNNIEGGKCRFCGQAIPGRWASGHTGH